MLISKNPIITVLIGLLISACSAGQNDNNGYLQESLGQVQEVFSLNAKRIQDQTIVPSSKLHLVNPYPNMNTCDKDFALKIAIIDTGVDYNSPYLAQNISYQCNDNGEPIGFGLDDLGKDDWASPYLVRTDHLNRKLSSKQRRDGVKLQNEYEQFYSELTDPLLKELISPHLLYDTRITHGTQVAALASYDDNRIGITGYRPIMDPHKGFLVSTQSVLDMSKLAIQDGAKIINLSLSFYQVEGEFLYNRIIKQAQKDYYKLVKNNPDVIFVAATGNESNVLNFSKPVKSFPCGINLPNVICVGSIDQSTNISKFSNTTKNYKNTVYALGEDIEAIVPSKYCSELANSSVFDSLLLARNKNQFSMDLFSFNLTRIAESCESSIKRTSGTSFATPLVSRKVAQIWIDQPHLTSVEVVEELLFQSTQHNSIKHGEINIFQFEKASWQN